MAYTPVSREVAEGVRDAAINVDGVAALHGGRVGDARGSGGFRRGLRRGGCRSRTEAGEPRVGGHRLQRHRGQAAAGLDEGPAIDRTHDVSLELVGLSP